jgi:hypothetical protein
LTPLARELPERFFERQDGVSCLATVLAHRSTAILMDQARLNFIGVPLAAIAGNYD